MNKPYIKCDNCGGRGTVSLIDQKSRYWAFACICPNGLKWTNRLYHQWNGLDKQIHGNLKLMNHRFITINKAGL